jgi:hypothetical protein
VIIGALESRGNWFSGTFRGMKTLEIQVSDEIVTRIEQAAQEKGLSFDELIQISVEEKLARDDEFEKAARRVLTKNAELYKRLA